MSALSLYRISLVVRILSAVSYLTTRRRKAYWDMGTAAQTLLEGITEQLKAENALEWVGRINNIQAAEISPCRLLTFHAVLHIINHLI